MIKRFNKSNDMKIELVTNLDITSSIFKYYTDGAKYISKTLSSGIDKLNDTTYRVSINGSELSTLVNGQLKCNIEINTDDKNFADNEYNSTITQNLDIYLFDK